MKAYIESVDEKEAETKAMQDRIIECENRENDRKSNLQVSRQQHTNALDEREALPDHPEGVDPQEEKTLAVRKLHTLFVFSLAASAHCLCSL